MNKSLATLLAITATNAVKLANQDCTTYSAQDVQVSLDGLKEAKVSFTEPSTDMSDVESYKVVMNEQEFECEKPGCKIDISALNLEDGSMVSATVTPTFAKDFVVPFPVSPSPAALACEAGAAAQRLFQGISEDDHAMALSAFNGCPIDQKAAPLFEGFVSQASALSRSIELNFHDVAMKLIDMGADVNEQASGYFNHAPLSFACHQDVTENPELFDKLIVAGADVNQKEGKDGDWTAPHVCAASNRVEGLKKMLGAGAQQVGNKINRTALGTAMENPAERQAAIDYLTAQGWSEFAK